uniref:SMC hinge domain-containing protein n=1 Tax=Pyxicephalus adspersus TaxID=30357 RepID=A0AAV3AFV3_PYXAD|nr:TPA: hypothetical protein GDO54_010431 [Pyxicephalus adspersus]
MPPKKTKTCTAGPGHVGEEPREQDDATPTAADGESPTQATNEAMDNRSLEEILSSIPPPPPPAMTNEAGAPRLMITHIVNQNFKSYAGEQILGPFHKRFSCIIGPNGSGKSNVIDSMLFVFGYRAQKIRSKKLSVLIHNSDEHKDIQSCTVEVHFQKIIDKEGDEYEVIPNSKFYVSRTAYKDNSSVYHISGKKSSFKDVGVVLRSHGIDLDHNRFLILQLNRVKLVEKEKDALEGEKNKAVEFLNKENETFKMKNQVCQYYIHEMQKRIHEEEQKKEKVQEETKEISEKTSALAEEMKAKSKALKDVEKEMNKINKFVEESREKFTQLDLQDVDLREKLKHGKSKVKKLQKQLQKDKEKVEELKSVPANSQKIIGEATDRKGTLEKQKEKEEEKLKEVMDSLKIETQGLQEEKEGDLGAIDEKYDVAISSSCGALDHIVVDTIDTAQECVNFLKRQNIGVATFIGLDKMNVWEKGMNKIQTPENIPRLFDMVKVKDEHIKPAFYFALRDTLVADNLDQATKVAFQKDKRWRVVTLQGQIIEQSGKTFKHKGLQAMESKLKSGSEKAAVIQDRKVQLEEEVAKLRQSTREMKNTFEKFTANLQSLSEQEIHLKAQVKELEVNVASTAPDKNQQKQMEKNVEMFKKEFEKAAEKAGKIEAEVKRLHNLIVEINNHKLKAQQDKVDKINKEIDECTSSITKAQVSIKTADRNLKKAEESAVRTEKEIVDNDKSIEELSEELKQLEEKAAAVMNECKEAESTLPDTQEKHKGLLQEMKSIQDQEHALQKDSLNIRLKIEQIDSSIAEHQSKIKHWQKEISKLTLHTIEGNTEEVLSTLTQEELEAIKNPRQIEEKIALLEAESRNMKPNLGAIAAYKQKVSFLHVRPPKKSWKKIFNLSGGEKTLSSLALVFALHHYKPTPLYFMDEIDAAIDFKNVSIVAFYIYEQTKNAQFIIISLRNNMFEIADRLIGIYKTHNTTKSVATNPKVIALKGLSEISAAH